MKIGSLFPVFVKKYFKGLVTALVTKIDDKKGEPEYFYKALFKKKYEPTLKFESLIGRGSISAADVVAVDSPLPLKKRDSISKSEGDIPKMGMKLSLRESEMNNIDTMIALDSGGTSTKEVVKLLFGDVKKCIHGIHARLEILALQALSTGTISITSENNTGTTNRLEFAIPSANRGGASVKWETSATAKPLDDIEAIQTKARKKGDKLKYILMSPTSFNQFKKTAQVLERYAAYLNLAGSNTIVPSLSKANMFMLEDYGMQIVIVDSSVQIEKNGKKTAITPWEEGKVTLLNSMEVGDLAYGTCAEERRPVAGVVYEKADDIMLLSKFSTNEPLAEFTSVQSYALPVLNDVESIYQLNTLKTTWA
ncbi:major capsid protein [Flavicella sediminum]|uniref:major capsid protein n=1 Tax=Flavicella sediminum TaxID=2585141 RepID=UPI001123921B|nr:major capsid protein [Flavicella sediminum]